MEGEHIYCFQTYRTLIKKRENAVKRYSQTKLTSPQKFFKGRQFSSGVPEFSLCNFLTISLLYNYFVPLT
jgi:hypothetical protein